MFPGQQQLATKQTYEGIAENLRINPYGVRTGLPLSGFFNTNAFDQIVESGTRIAASAEWRRCHSSWTRMLASFLSARVVPRCASRNTSVWGWR